VVRYYTLVRDDPDLNGMKRTPHGRLGYAVTLCYLRHPGRVPEPDEQPPVQLLDYVAGQVGTAARSATSQRSVGTAAIAAETTAPTIMKLVIATGRPQLAVKLAIT
jgi:hypothetical protein